MTASPTLKLPLTGMVIDLAKSILGIVETLEVTHGPQPRLRHWLHGAAAEAERVLSMKPGTISPDGGTAKPGT